MQYMYKVSKHLTEVRMLIEGPIPENGIYLQEIDSKPQEEASPEEVQYHIVRTVKELRYPIGRLFLKSLADGIELTLSDRPFDIPKKEYDLDSKEFMDFHKLLLASIPENWKLQKIS